MDIFTPTYFSFLFKAMIVLFPISLVLKILRNLYIDDRIKALVQLPDERKERIIRLYRSAISMWRIFLWIMPFGFLVYLVLPVLLFITPDLASAVPDVNLRQVALLMGLAFVYLGIHIVDDFNYKKKILRAIEK